MGQYIGQSFTEAGTGNSVGVDPGEAVSFAASGTYTGAITVERSRDNGATWQAALVGGSGAVFGGFYKNESGGPERYRLVSTVTTGTAVTKINDIERVPMAIPGEARASHTVTGPLVFSPGDPAEKGSCLMRLVADGTNAPDFSAFVLVGAGEWVNTAAAVNIVHFFRLGGVDYYSVLSTGSGSGGLPKITNGTLFTLGDSIVAGTGATSADARFPNRIAAATGLALTNIAINGMQMDSWTTANGVWEQSLPTVGYLADHATAVNDTYAWMLGYNDARLAGANVVFLRTYAKEVNGLISWLGVADSAKRRMQAGGVLDTARWTFAGGTWTLFTGWGGAMGAFIGTNNATATLNEPMSGDTVQVWYGATFNNGTDVSPPGVIVTIDGIDYGPFSCRTPSFNNKWQLLGARITGLANGPHTIVLKAAVAAGGGNVTVGGVACWDSGAAPACNVYAADLPYMWMAQPAANITISTITTADGYSLQTNYGLSSQWTTAASRDGVSERDFAFEHYNRIIFRECRAARKAGLKVAHVDTNAYYDPNGMIDRLEGGNPGSHPVNGGHAAIAQAFLSEIRRPTYPEPY